MIAFFHDNHDLQDLQDQFYNQIVRRRDIPRRMNWRQRANALSQRELVTALMIYSSFYLYLVFLLIFMINQTLLLINQARNLRFINPVPRLNKLRHVLIYYQCLLTFSCHELDILIQEDDALLNLRQRDIIPYANRPPINRTIDSLSESDALEFTRFKKNQLQLLLLHLRLPNIVIIGPCRYKFTGEELLIVYLTYIASGMIAHWQHLFHDFRWAILNRLGKPAHQMEVDFDEQLGRPEFIIQAPLESWRVFGFIDDTNVRTCQPGSGPVGNGVGAG